MAATTKSEKNTNKDLLIKQYQEKIKELESKIETLENTVQELSKYKEMVEDIRAIMASTNTLQKGTDLSNDLV